MTAPILRTASTAAAHVLFILLIAPGCGPAEDLSDAYGTFEATEVLVSAETAGRLVRFGVTEGETLEAGRLAAVVDTLPLVLRLDQLDAQRAAVSARLAGITAQVQVLEEQLRVARREADRVQGLFEAGAASSKQRDDAEGAVSVLERQVEAARTQSAPVRAEMQVVDAQRAVVEDQVARSRVVNPMPGTVLVTYAEPSELTAPGKPLYRIARLDTLTLRAYVSGAQLAHLALGDRVTVLVDEDETTNRELTGVVTWIASEAEFTPKPIQTKEERVSLVYAFKVRVPNPDGALKIGMPGEVRFAAAAR